jgi:DNA helicase-2/ATP-dependent DNA helicase PcrA
MHPLLEALNPAQREAVSAPPGPALVLAGAGSGKTRVLTHRLAWLVQVEGLSPWGILAVTFTNKAAGEMRARTERLLGTPASGLWIGTFHGLAHRLLRLHWREANLPQTFQILDADDQQRLIKRVMRALAMDEARWPPKQAQGFINGRKDEGQRPQDIPDGPDPYLTQMKRVYAAYEEHCARTGLVDFAELLLRSFELLRDHAELLAHYRARFTHLLVDEFQDTNALQYAWLRQLAGDKGQLFAVGDDDQCLTAGTRITMADGSVKPIERLRPNDAVLSCFGNGDFRASRIMACHKHSGMRQLVTLRLKSGRTLTSTAEHTHFAGYLLGETPQTHFLYLMYKRGVGYRLGTSQVHTKGQARPMVGFRQRALQEHADALWVIRTHRSENDARADETITALHYGIPTLPFVPRKAGANGGGNGLVHDRNFIKRVYAAIDSEGNAKRLLCDTGLDPDCPHHQPRSRNSNRHNIMLTLCADRRGMTPMHRLSMVGNDPQVRRVLKAMGLPVRAAKRGSRSWRIEAVNKNFGVLVEMARNIGAQLEANTVLQAHILSRSLPFTSAAHVRPGMVLVTEAGEYDVVEQVDARRAKTTVYDLDIEHTHNFIANGLVTHNSIYGWRGARIENIRRFNRDCPAAQVYRLEQNYRSTATILAAANGVIARNQGRLGKKLWTDGAHGEPVLYYSAFNDLDEARFIAERARGWCDAGRPWADCAVLYRSNAQSRVIEEALIQSGIPYRIYGGLRFFERAEIKDALAYLRLTGNRDDDAAFERVVNQPPRGIGDRTLETLRSEARTRRVSLWQCAADLLAGGTLAPRTAGALRGFLMLMEQLGEQCAPLALGEQIEHLLAKSTLMDHYRAERGERGEMRVENLEELVRAARDFRVEGEETAITPRDAFLAQAALEAGEGQGAPGADCLSLMTLHAAKGLEFPLVFLCGMEDGLFPHSMSMQAPERLEEERRLCYVGMTRAREQLILSSAERRRLHGNETYSPPSRFIAEIPEHCLRELRPRVQVSRPVSFAGHAHPSAASGHYTRGKPATDTPARTFVQRDTDGGLRLGQTVRHASFGEGVVLACEGNGAQARVQVRFKSGAKWLVASYAKLEAV